LILIDTTPLVALCDPRDRLHRRALADVDRAARLPLVVCGPVLTEACFLLDHAVQRQRLERLLVELDVRPFTVEDESQIWAAVFAWLARYAEHEPDWADGYLAVASGMEKKARVWTYDSEFRTVWRRPDGTKIPLVTK
jgi:predicted nucleic acid-binding protein